MTKLNEKLYINVQMSIRVLQNLTNYQYTHTNNKYEKSTLLEIHNFTLRHLKNL